MTVNIEIKSSFDSNGSIYTDDFPSLSICDKQFFHRKERTKIPNFAMSIIFCFIDTLPLYLKHVDKWFFKIYFLK